MFVLQFVTISFCVTVVWAAQTAPAFSNGTSVGNIDSVDLDEASGCAASRKFPDVLYMHNDHGDRPRIFAVNASNAQVIAVFEISPAVHNDWEDIAVGPCSDGGSQSCMYILDDGEYHHVDKRTVYRVVEPDQLISQTIAPDSVLKYNWSESAANTIMVDNHANAFIISNILGGRGMMIQLPNIAWDSPDPVWVDSGSYFSMFSKHTDPEGGDISSDGNEVLVKISGHVYYWKTSDGNVIDALIHPGANMPYTDGRRVESVCWSADALAYYTLSEGSHADLYKYNRE